MGLTIRRDGERSEVLVVDPTGETREIRADGRSDREPTGAAGLALWGGGDGWEFVEWDRLESPGWDVVTPALSGDLSVAGLRALILLQRSSHP